MSYRAFVIVKEKAATNRSPDPDIGWHESTRDSAGRSGLAPGWHARIQPDDGDPIDVWRTVRAPGYTPPSISDRMLSGAPWIDVRGGGDC